MRFIVSSFGSVMLFFSVLLTIYDTLVSFRTGTNRFHSVTDLTHFFMPGYVSPFRFGLRGNEFIWTDVLLPLFNFPFCFLLFMVGMIFARVTPTRSFV